MQSTLVKATKIGLAVAALMASSGASAAGATFDVYVTGASALRDSMPRILNRFCQANSVATPRTITRFAGSTITSATVDNDRRAFTCTFLTQTGVGFAQERAELTASGLDGDIVTVYHSVEPGNSLDALVGGSITGIIPLLAGTPGTAGVAGTGQLVNFVNKTASPTNVITAAGTDATVFVGAALFNAAGPTAQVANDPQIGLTDVEPKLFTAAYGNLPTAVAATGAGWVIPPGQNPANLTGAVAFQGGFGVAVSQNLFAAGLTNISQDQLAAVLSGDVSTWDQIGGPALPVKICRRSPGSGTQATFNALVSRKACGANKTTGAEYTVISEADAGDINFVQENATTTLVKTCLTAANTGGTLGAIGILGLENNTNDGTYALIDVNGIKVYDTVGDSVDGTPDNIREDRIISGAYPLVVDSTVQKSLKVTLGLEQNNFYNLIAQQAGNTNITKALPGIVSTPAKRTAFVGAALLSGGASSYSRTGDSCAPSKYQP